MLRTRPAHQPTRSATTAAGSTSPVFSSVPPLIRTRQLAVRAASPSARGILLLTSYPPALRYAITCSSIPPAPGSTRK